MFEIVVETILSTSGLRQSLESCLEDQSITSHDLSLAMFITLQLYCSTIKIFLFIFYSLINILS